MSVTQLVTTWTMKPSLDSTTLFRIKSTVTAYVKSPALLDKLSDYVIAM